MEDVTSGAKGSFSSSTKRKFVAKLPKWLIATLAGVVLGLSILSCLLLVRDPRAPSAIVVFACRDITPGIHRIAADFGTQFNVSEKAFTINAATQDMPPGRFYVITLRNSSANMVVWHDDGIWGDLKNSSPIFSRHIKETFSSHIKESRIRMAKEGSVGTDRWGYLKSGERWRYVVFASGDAVGYRPVPLEQAVLFDEVINSACRAD